MPPLPSRSPQPHTPPDEAFSPAPMSVWPTAQQVSKTQRAGRYTPETFAHPAKMLPAIARHAIRAYTNPGDLVVDPMCGIGTTLVEAVHLGRRALGIEYEPRWARIAGDNLALAADQDATAHVEVLCDDARRVTADLRLTHRDRAQLVVTSPPYGASVHGQVDPVHGHGVHKRDDRYSNDRGNLAHQRLTELLAGFTNILHGCLPLLTPGGYVVITTRPFRAEGELIDFPSLTLDAAIAAGLHPVQRCVALLAGLRDGHLIPRTSFFQLDYIRKLRHHGIPASVLAHEDVLVLTRPSAPALVPPQRLTMAVAP